LNKEQEELTSNIKDLSDIIESKLRREEVLVERLDELVKKFGDKRRTDLEQIEVPKEDKEIEEIVPEDVVVVMTQTGYIKRVPTKSFRIQKRGGKGTKTKDDALLDMIKTNTIDALMVFTDAGKMYRIIVDNIPQGTNATKGVLIHTLIKLDQNEKVMAVTSLHRTSQPGFVIFFTKKGLIKKSRLEEYTGVKRSTGIQAIKLKEGDSIANIIFQDEEDLIIATKAGMGIKIPSKDINAIGRVTSGVKGINLKDGDEVLKGLPIHKDTDTLMIVGENGLAKRIKYDEMPTQNRGGRGVSIYPSSIAGVAMVDDEDSLLLVGTSTICVATNEVPVQSRIAQGVKMIKDGEVYSVVKL
jgi:DNA gyrase subunit A